MNLLQQATYCQHDVCVYKPTWLVLQIRSRFGLLFLPTPICKFLHSLVAFFDLVGPFCRYRYCWSLLVLESECGIRMCICRWKRELQMELYPYHCLTAICQRLQAMPYYQSICQSCFWCTLCNMGAEMWKYGKMSPFVVGVIVSR